MDAVIITIPRMAPSRPSAGTALIKSLLTAHNYSNRLLDINIDFFNRFAVDYGAEQFQELDRYLYTDNITLSAATKISYQKFLEQWIQRIVALDSQWILISIFTTIVLDWMPMVLKSMVTESAKPVTSTGLWIIID